MEEDYSISRRGFEEDGGSAMMGLLSQHCYATLTTDNMFDHTCIHELIMNALSWCIIIGATVVKLPQIIKIISAGNVAGLSETSFVIEVFAGFFFIGYNVLGGYPFSAWGDVAFVGVQSMILVMLYWQFSHPMCKDPLTGLSSPSNRFTFRLAYCAVFLFTMTIIFGGCCPRWVVPLLGLVPVPCSIAARVPQIYQNIKQQHTGQLSLLTMSMMLGGNLARLATVISLRDPILLAANSIAAVTNAIPLLQT
eukprot:GHVQ01018659.1.p1 GENE.GHVQ01018659.1~~GHVQ01018659.1.p1  ORF type:complete len:251 (+),score=27.01 GHVQ01018659.1:190-942(+)